MVLKVKYGENGDIERFQCRVVAQGFSQTQGVDYEKSFAPVAGFNMITALLAMAVNCDMIVHQMDVVTAFLNGSLKEEIYMRQPEGFIKEGDEELMCKLKKSLYGLKQSPRCWYEKLKIYLTNADFKQCVSEPCVFYRWENGKLTIVTVYVDDLILMADLMDSLLDIKCNLESTFIMKDLGPLSFITEISVRQTDGQIQLHQKQYILNMLARFNMFDAYPVHTPTDTSVHLVKDDGISGK